MSQITYHICSRVLWNLNVWAILFPLYLDYGFLLLVLMGGAGSDEYKTLSYHHLMLVHLVSLETVTCTHTDARAHTPTHTHTQPHTHTRARAHTHTRTHSNTHTHEKICSYQ